jgi:hypothetical protein
MSALICRVKYAASLFVLSRISSVIGSVVCGLRTPRPFSPRSYLLGFLVCCLLGPISLAPSLTLHGLLVCSWVHFVGLGVEVIIRRYSMPRERKIQSRTRWKGLHLGSPAPPCSVSNSLCQQSAGVSQQRRMLKGLQSHWLFAVCAMKEEDSTGRRAFLSRGVWKFSLLFFESCDTASKGVSAL